MSLEKKTREDKIIIVREDKNKEKVWVKKEETLQQKLKLK